MALKQPTNKELVTTLHNRVTEAEKKTEDQQTLTKFFTIVVASTIVATLVGIIGVYLSLFGSRQDNTREILELQRQISENNLKIDLLRANNKYLK